GGHRTRLFDEATKPHPVAPKQVVERAVDRAEEGASVTPALAVVDVADQRIQPFVHPAVVARHQLTIRRRDHRVDGIRWSTFVLRIPAFALGRPRALMPGRLRRLPRVPRPRSLPPIGPVARPPHTRRSGSARTPRDRRGRECTGSRMPVARTWPPAR